MNTQTTQKSLPIYRGELALLLAVAINSFGVVLMLYSGTGISAISSVPYAFSCVFPKISLGTWTYIFQGLLVLALMILRKKFVVQYLFSFVVGFVFGELLDVHELWINVLPMPIVPTDLFPRELSQITSVAYPKIKISFDVICLIITAALTGFGLGHIKGLGIGTVVAAFTMGKGVGIAGNWLDKHMDFTSFLAK